MSLTVVGFIIAASSALAASGLWVVRNTKPDKSKRAKNILAFAIVVFFAIAVGGFVAAIGSYNANNQQSRDDCREVRDGYVVKLNGYSYCFEEPPKLIGKI